MSAIDEAVEFAIETTTAILGPGGELDARAAAFHRALRERGYVVVPVEPTEAMWRAGAKAFLDLPNDEGMGDNTLMSAIYRAMLGAAR